MPCKSQSQCALSDNANLGLQMQKADRERKMRVRKGGEETGREKGEERGRGKKRYSRRYGVRHDSGRAKILTSSNCLKTATN